MITKRFTLRMFRDDMGSFVWSGCTSKEDALWHINSARAHDGLRPIDMDDLNLLLLGSNPRGWAKFKREEAAMKRYQIMNGLWYALCISFALFMVCNAEVRAAIFWSAVIFGLFTIGALIVHGMFFVFCWFIQQLKKLLGPPPSGKA